MSIKFLVFRGVFWVFFFGGGGSADFILMGAGIILIVSNLLAGCLQLYAETFFVFLLPPFNVCPFALFFCALAFALFGAHLLAGARLSHAASNRIYRLVGSETAPFRGCAS